MNFIEKFQKQQIMRFNQRISVNVFRIFGNILRFFKNYADQKEKCLKKFLKKFIFLTNSIRFLIGSMPFLRMEVKFLNNKL